MLTQTRFVPALAVVFEIIHSRHNNCIEIYFLSELPCLYLGLCLELRWSKINSKKSKKACITLFLWNTDHITLHF